MRTALTTLLAALLVGVGAACGGDGDSDADTAFQAQVDAVCAELGPKLELLSHPAEDVDEWAAIGADMGDLLEASVNELRLIEPPDDLSDDYGEWLDLRAQLLTAIRELQDAGGLHDQAAVDSAIHQVQETIESADAQAEELGFESCSPTGIRTER